MALPRVCTIESDRPFADTLAAGVLAELGDEPTTLARATILLPTRRGCRALREAFLRRSGGRPLLLPRLMPIGDIDEDEALFAATAAATALPPEVPALRRQLLLARLVLAGRGGHGRGESPTPEQAARLAAELGRLLDQVQTERLSFDRLADLVPHDYAEHWQITIEFLRILTEAWPGVLAEERRMDRVTRRDRLAAAQGEAWRRRPPAGPVIAAGSTGSIPSTADLIAVVASLPQGCVVLPGLDRAMDDAAWAEVGETHPQYSLKRLIERLGVDRAQVADWPTPALDGQRAHPDRRRLLGEAMRPAATTDRWRALPPISPEALEGVARVDAPGPREEALVIALMLREALESPGRTAALVTPDRALARRVGAELGRWGIAVDDSAGRPLGETPPGTFLRLTADLVAEGFAPLPLLAVLKHPLAAGGMDPARFRTLARRLETRLLRGPRPAPGIAGLRAALAAGEARPGDASLEAWLGRLEGMARPFAEAMAAERIGLADAVKAHMEFAEALATSADLPGAARLWAEDAGEAAAGFAADLHAAADALPPIAPAAYPGLLEALMEGRPVRPSHGGHPRLAIWGPLEARMQQADVVVLGGLNEGAWPPLTQADPWMSRPMRSRFGLPLPERRIGLSAHDFCQAFGAPRVVLTRAQRVDGTPTVPSRWLLRLEAVIRAAGLGAPLADRYAGGTPWLAWSAAIDRPDPDAFMPGSRPAPRPPLAARPNGLSVTQIETWMRDPYAIYARHVLRLRALDPLDADPGAADYGTAVHAVLETFVHAFPETLPDDAEARLIAMGAEAFAPLLARPGVWAFWWPRFARIARWVAAREAQRRQAVARSFTEVKGRLAIDRPTSPPFALTAKADRIDAMRDGTLGILDYKTGLLPSGKEIEAGYAPQLPLEAAIARAGGFAGIPARPVSSLTYWRLSGSGDGGRQVEAGSDAAALADAALAGVRRLVAAFDDAATPYQARPHPKFAPRYSDYQHLARVKEWAAAAGEADE